MIHTTSFGGIKIVLCSLLVWAGSSCQSTTKTATKTTTPESYFPALWSDIQLGHSKTAVLGARPNANRVNALVETTYESFTEDLPQEEYTSVYYDFSRTSPQQLVRMRLLHYNIAAFKESLNLFGGTLTDNANSIYTRTLTDKSKVHIQTINTKIIYFLPNHQPAISKTKVR